jgi:hypothetical protein
MSGELRRSRKTGNFSPQLVSVAVESGGYAGKFAL